MFQPLQHRQQVRQALRQELWQPLRHHKRWVEIQIGYPIVPMPMMSCPLCGKMSSMDSYNPHHFADDIFVVEVRGLGRGRGFEVTNRDSIFSHHRRMDPYIDRTLGDLRDRTLDILNMLNDQGIIPEAQIVERMHQRRLKRDLRTGS